MATCGNRPFIYGNLVGRDPGPAPCGVGCETVERFDIKIENLSIGGHRVFHTHHELHIERPPDGPALLHRDSLEDVAEVEGLDLAEHGERGYPGS